MSAEAGIDLVRRTWRLDGPYTTESVISAAAAIAELWRYLGHSTSTGTRRLLSDPADAHTLVGQLLAADQRATDVLDRLGNWAIRMGDESTHTDRFGHDNPDGRRDQVQATAHQAADLLRCAARAHSSAGHHLEQASGWLSHLYRND
ncbi:hypothetical protein [Nocardia transvalensis]|uniref:hypothetical protein n=1 Tax=Nocardia transvalensis TaxID=37333 RepID=UPI001894B176|nr:hypothetical protein [Nocardia transvalensis]MBF6334237.1 hypothetical protein [Nocardia transvalensis]